LSAHKLYSKCFPLARPHARSLAMVNSLVKNKLFKAAPDIDEPPFQFIHTMDLSVVDTMLHDSPKLVIHRTEIWAVWRPQVGRRKSLAFLDATVQLLHMRGAVCPCTVLLEHKIVTRHSVCRWQHYDVIMTSRSSVEEVNKKYQQNFLLHNNNEITACIADLFNSFCEEVYAVAFFKVVQQQTTGE